MDVKHDHINAPSETITAALVVSIITIYLLFVYQIGPRWMKNRPAFQLKYFTRLYNVVQVVACLYIISETWNISHWSLFDFRKCEYYLPDTPKRREYNIAIYHLFILKVIEMTDTVIFVLRKKSNQITYLHVFHHTSTVTISYLIIRYYIGNAALFPAFLNSGIHVIMYTYYLFANMCSAETMKKYVMIKKSITIMQMLQFCMMLVHTCAMWENCNIHPFVKIYYSLVVIVIFYGFYDFYKKAYTKNPAKTLKKKTQ